MSDERVRCNPRITNSPGNDALCEREAHPVRHALTTLLGVLLLLLFGILLSGLVI